MRRIFALAILGIGIETIVCANVAASSLGPGYAVVPVIPWLPSILALAILFGALAVACALAMFTRKRFDEGAAVLGYALAICAIVLLAPRVATNPASGTLRTALFETLAIASLALMMSASVPRIVATVAHYVFAASLVVFGVDHFRALGSIASLVPGWIPWHMFWAQFFGAAFIVAGLGIAMRSLERWAYGGIALLFALFLVTLHLPRTLGLYGIPGAIHDPNEWSSLLIALALCGGAAERFWELRWTRAWA